MKNSTILAAVLTIASAFSVTATASAKASTRGNNTLLMQCSFVGSASISFGYRTIYTIKGNVRQYALNGPEHFTFVDDPASVSIDNMPSTNFVGRHVGDTTAKVEVHPSNENVMLAVNSTDRSGPMAFRILVFPGVSQTPNPYYRAYLVPLTMGPSISGACYQVDPRLTE